MKDIKGKAIRGGFFKVCAQAVSFLLRIGSLMVLARLLEPEDFGLVAMVTVVTGVFSLFKDAGLSMATVQRASITDEQISTLFWINLLVGALLGFLTVAIGPVLVAFYHEPRLFWVAMALAAGFVVNAAGVQHGAILQRQMRFAALAVIDILSLLSSIAAGIALAAGGYGYWALVGMALILPVTSTVCVWLAAAWVPGMPHREVGIRSMMQYGGTITLNGLVVYMAYNAEKVLLGRYWGADALGIYGRAYQLINMPTENLNTAIGGVAFSALSRLHDDPSRLKSYFLKGYALVLALTIPITIACALFADDIIFVVLGPKWQEAALIFQLLTPTILIYALINPLGWLLFSIGKVRRSLNIALVIAPLVITAYVMGLPYGPNGVAFAYSAVMTLWLIPHITWCIHGTTISWRDLLQAVSRPFISAIVAAAVAGAANAFFGQSLHPFPRLLLGSIILLVTYPCMLLYVLGQKTVYIDLLRQLKASSSLGEKRSEVV
jgi:O-antigen/teichoic acid export membrane protein